MLNLRQIDSKNTTGQAKNIFNVALNKKPHLGVVKESSGSLVVKSAGNFLINER